MLRLLKREIGDDLAILSVGGVTTAEDMQERLDAGADLVQGYTAFLYEGPALGGTLTVAWKLRRAQPLKVYRRGFCSPCADSACWGHRSLPVGVEAVPLLCALYSADSTHSYLDV